uniref:transposase n=1 Tax=Streptomyces kaempferi TaxID=333725 RepID=UPI0036D438A0
MSQSDLQRLLESLRTADGVELVRHIAERMLQELIEAELSGRIGAQWNEHTEDRTNFRNGHRDKTLTSQAGDLDLAIPQRHLPPVLLPSRRYYKDAPAGQRPTCARMTQCPGVRRRDQSRAGTTTRVAV